MEIRCPCHAYKAVYIVEMPLRVFASSMGFTQVHRPGMLPPIAVDHLIGLFKLKRELDAKVSAYPLMG